MKALTILLALVATAGSSGESHYQPNDRQSARILFSRPLTESELLAFAERHPLEFQVLHVAWAGQTGGHRLAATEELGAAIAQVGRHYEGLLTDLADSIERKGRRTLSDAERAATNNLAVHTQQLLDVLETRGVQYVGVTVSGSAASLQQAKAQDPTIRAVDYLQTGFDPQGKAHSASPGWREPPAPE